jgi:uncharacterized protein (TIGR02246 family)
MHQQSRGGAVLDFRRMAGLLTIAALSLGACGPKDQQERKVAPAGSLSSRDSAAIVALDSAFVAAVNAGDAKATAAVYASDAALLAPNLPLQRGRRAIQSFWGGLLEAYTVTFEIGSDMLEGRGDLAYNMGHYRFTAVPKAKNAAGTADEGKYVEILKQQADGSWKYQVDIYNSSLAPQH